MFYFSLKRITVGMLSLAAAYSLFVLINDLSQGSIYRYILNGVFIVPLNCIYEVKSWLPSHEAFSFFEQLNRTLLTEKDNANVFEMVNEWSNAALYIAIPSSLLFNLLDPVRYARFRTKAKPLSDWLYDPQWINLKAKLGDIDDIFVIESEHVNVMGVGDKNRSAVFVTRGYLENILDNDSPTTLISLFLHERVKIQQGITDIAFTIQMSLFIFLISMTLIYLIVMKKKSYGSFVDMVALESVNVGALLLLGMLPIYFLLRAIAEYAEEKAWRDPLFDDIDALSYTLKQGKGLPVEYRFLGCASN